ncbi:response regulator [Desulfovibrio sp. OttesenSCG-928-O18]|nr:response regulator [Desulfovibrio sp. OttesenSCG-928-O18]
MNTISSDDAVQRFATIWEHVECGISIIDAETREILAINPVAARMFGDDVSKILGKRCHKFICPAESCSCPIMDKGQVVDRSERKFVKADGTTIPIVKSVAKIQYNGRLALLESFTDISNLKEAEEKLVHLQVTEEANRAKSDFLSRMSHEMRTPMNAIIGMTKIAEGTDDVDKLKYCLSMIGVSANHLLGLINDVLDMAKIESGKFELDAEPLSIEEILIKICNLIMEQTEEKGITLHVSLGPDMAMRYVGDELRLSQVIANLMSNAVKFSPKGGTITLSADEVERRDNSSIVRFSVADTGIGMTPEQIAKLFNAFEQADTSISRRFGGTGLGLVISQSIVEKMNGSIRVSSTPGSGSTFTVDVELLHPVGQGNGDAFAADLAGKKILVVDSDSDSREQFALLAEKAGIRGESTADGADALVRINAAQKAGEPYDAIFVDNAHAPLTNDLPPGTDMCSLVLMATLQQWNKLGKEPRSAIRHFLAKPLFPSAIVGAIREASGISNAAAENSAAFQEAAYDFSRISLLLAEDVEINREIFASLLESTGVRIDIAENGSEALEKFRSAPDKYDIIVMDVQMPGMDGYEATKAIRALDMERAKSIPIIAMTANAFKSDIEKCMACGMDGHLAKPIDEKAVIETIRSYCAK